MKKTIFAILLICICSSNLFAQSNLTSEDYAVYNEVLESMYKDFLKQSEQFGIKPTFVILEDTVKLDFVPSGFTNKKSLLDYSNESLPPDLEDLLKDFKEKNKFSVKLKKQSPTDYEYNIVSTTELNNLLEEGRKEQVEYAKKCHPCFWGDGWIWQPLRRKYPNSAGYHKFSRIGFSSDKKSALVYLDEESAGHGSSWFSILEKTDGKWKIRERLWVTSWDT